MTAGGTAHASALLSQHAAHLLAVGIPVALLLIGLTWDSLRTSWHRALPSSSALVVAAAASVAAAGVHVRVFPEHLAESALYGAFFACAAVAQLVGAWLLLRQRSRALVALVAAGNAAIIVLWLITRLVVVPLGPGAGTVEPFQAIDITAGLLEGVIVVACVYSLRLKVLAAA
jgi:hypothetical protein